MKATKSTFVLRVACAVFALAMATLTIAPQASASPVQDCQALIGTLRAATETVTITGKNAEKDRAGLLGKLDAASADLNSGKLCGAIRKLTDFRNKVNQLIAAGKINTDPNAGVTGQDLVVGANESIACVESLVAQSGTTCPTIE
jgi:hypothetical protein